MNRTQLTRSISFSIFRFLSILIWEEFLVVIYYLFCIDDFEKARKFIHGRDSRSLDMLKPPHSSVQGLLNWRKRNCDTT